MEGVASLELGGGGTVSDRVYPPPSLVVIDLWLRPREPDGLEVLALIVERCPAAAAVILTGGGYSERAFFAGQEGACAFLLKPSSAHKILQAASQQRRTRKVQRLDELKLKAILLAVAAARGNKSLASRMLGISRKTLDNHLPLRPEGKTREG
jgi:DNA-binding NtrC family response regulator